MGLIKTTSQLNNIRQAGQKLAELFEIVKPAVKSGATTLELEQLVHRTINQLGAKPSFLQYEGYPYSSCISVNSQVIHAFPSDYILRKGDILTIDVGLWYKKVCVDAARTYGVEPITKADRTLIEITDQALAEGIKSARLGNRVGAISSAVQSVALSHDLGIVRSYTGHGVGTAVHEEPSIPNVGVASDGPPLRAGMVIAIEPMFTLGSGDVYTENDGWTVVTADQSKAAQSEDTVIITHQGPEIVTRLLHHG